MKATRCACTTPAIRRREVFRFVGINQYQLEVEAFARAVAGKRGEIFSLEDSVKNQRVIDAIYAAGKSGGWEKV